MIAASRASTRANRILAHMVVAVAIVALFSGYLLAGTDLVASWVVGRQVTGIDWVSSFGVSILAVQTVVAILLVAWLAELA